METSSAVPSGIGPLDDRLGGLRSGGLYLLSAPPAPPRTAAVLQCVAAGLRDGGSAALVTRARPDRVFRLAEGWGLELRGPWEEERLRLLGFRGEHEARMRRAGSPSDVFEELAGLLEPVPDVLAFDPGSPLWEGRFDGVAASAFVDFVEGTGATALATTSAEPDQGLSSALELVSQAAAGVFRLEDAGRGLVRLRVHKLEPSGVVPDEVTLELASDAGLVAPTGTPGRRSSDRRGADPRAALVLHLDARLPDELEAWLRRRYDVTEVDAALGLVSALQEEASRGLALVHAERSRLEEARRACRVARRVRPSLALVALSSDRLRASDRASLLRAGADECLSAPLNVEEFASRLELAAARGGGGAAAEEREDVGDGADGADADGAMDEEAFRDEVRRRLESDDPGVFTVIRFRCPTPGSLLEEMRGRIRAEAGDFLGRVDGGCAVYLASTHPAEAEGFAARVREAGREAGDGGELELEVLGGVRDAARLRELTG